MSLAWSDKILTPIFYWRSKGIKRAGKQTDDGVWGGASTSSFFKIGRARQILKKRLCRDIGIARREFGTLLISQPRRYQPHPFLSGDDVLTRSNGRIYNGRKTTLQCA